jgi:uncharacterized protein YvpB
MSKRKIMGQRSLIALSLVVVSLSTGCSGESKKVQCGRFTQVTTQVGATLKTDETQNKTTDKTATANTIEGFQKLAKDSAEIFTQRTNRTDRAVKIIEELTVSDDQLKSLKNEYLVVIKKAADATRSIADIYTAKSKATAKTMMEGSFKKLDQDFISAVDTFTAAVTEEPQIIGKLNAYCNAK